MQNRKPKSERMLSFNRAIRKVLELSPPSKSCKVEDRSILNAIAILKNRDWIGINAANNLRSYFRVSK